VRIRDSDIEGLGFTLIALNLTSTALKQPGA